MAVVDGSMDKCVFPRSGKAKVKKRNNHSGRERDDYGAGKGADNGPSGVPANGKTDEYGRYIRLSSDIRVSLKMKTASEPEQGRPLFAGSNCWKWTDISARFVRQPRVNRITNRNIIPRQNYKSQKKKHTATVCHTAKTQDEYRYFPACFNFSSSFSSSAILRANFSFSLIKRRCFSDNCLFCSTNCFFS